MTNTAGTIIVQFKPSSWGYTKVGDLAIAEMEEGMRDMTLGTMIAMDWIMRISAAKEASRVEECRRTCEDEYRKACAVQNGNSLQAQTRGNDD